MHYPLLSLKKMDPAMLLFELNSVANRMSREDENMIISAAQLATYLHRDQRRFVRDGMPKVPYIEHPLRNALRLARWESIDAELLTMALLHDTAEDCADDYIELYGLNIADDATMRDKQHTMVEHMGTIYSPRVAIGVANLTNGYDNPEDSYLEHIQRHVDDDDFLLCKASDLHDNAGSLKHQVGGMKSESMLKRIKKYSPSIDVVYVALFERTQQTNNVVIENASDAMIHLSDNLIDLKQHLSNEKKLILPEMPQGKSTLEKNTPEM